MWRPARSAKVAEPNAVGALLGQAIAANPANATLHVKLADWHLDRFDFASAARSLEQALALDPRIPGGRERLARCNNSLGRPARAVAALRDVERPHHERALALLALGEGEQAEAEWRALLAVEPDHRQACRQLARLLRRSGRIAELVALCEDLAARGVHHSQLLYSWGTALALSGQHERAKALLLDPARVEELSLPPPCGFATIAEFNAALAEEIVGNPHRLGDFPAADEANRGSSRVHALFAGARSELIRGLLDSLQCVAERWLPPRYGQFDPWLDARPAAARLRAWGLIQRGEDYEDWHLHRGGWLSGVYYVRVPKSISGEGEGRGCIEFGAPTAVQRGLPGYLPVLRKVPREGNLLLAPSHYTHRTIPSGLDEYRISFAFDVVPTGGDEG